MSHEHVTSPQAQRRVVYALGALFVIYAATLAAGWPQKATRLIVEAESHARQAAAAAPAHQGEAATDHGDQGQVPTNDGHQ
ncbi:MAG: hypothetical protein GYA33_09720, partial [Thermogutta sp.]|nr:hypothetical protein [Thermogutta sp.]